MTQEEERYYEIGEASYEWVGERGDTEFRLGAEWADEHPRKGLVDIDKVCEWMKTNYTEFLDNSRLGISIEELVEDLRNDFKTK